MPRQPDEEDWALFTYPDADLGVSVEQRPDDVPELVLLGNRPGLASLANLLLWLDGQISREFLPVTQLPFVTSDGSVALSVRVSNDETTGVGGYVRRLDKGASYEWELPYHDLMHAAITAHNMAVLGDGHCHFPYSRNDIVDAEIYLAIADDNEDHRENGGT